MQKINFSMLHSIKDKDCAILRGSSIWMYKKGLADKTTSKLLKIPGNTFLEILFMLHMYFTIGFFFLV